MSQAPLNPYAAPKTDVVQEMAAGAGDWLPEELSAFVGSKEKYYRRVWAPLMNGKSGLKAGFNGGAFFFNVLWLLHRKMYREFLLFMIAPLTIGVLSAVVTLPPSVDAALDRAFNLAIACTVGFLGNGLYYRRTNAAIREARHRDPVLATRLEDLRKRGGTTWLWPLVAVAAFGGVIVLGVMVSQ
ncbi:MAG TPA: DUF2628 domain-containing protein [Polyangiaceae bacterium]|jgi:hypothetical protein